MKPIRVYLDSSDYSRLSDERVLASNPTLRTVKAFLVEAVTVGRIQVRYSAIHMAEFLHKSRGHRSLALARARLAKDLSGLKVFRPPMDICSMEGARLVLERKNPGVASKLSVACNDSGQWIPDLGPMAFELTRTIREQMSEELKSKNINRTQRRKIEREARRRGMLSRAAMARAANENVDVLKRMREIFPISDRFYDENLLSKLVSGAISEQEFARELLVGVTDPEHFVGWYVDLYDKDHATAAWVRDMNASIFRVGIESREKMEEIARRMEALGITGVDRLKMTEETILNARPDSRARILKMLFDLDERMLGNLEVGRSDWERVVIPSGHGSIPTLDTLLDIWPEYAKRIASRSRGGLRQSDGADMLHAMYLPHVDLFRADGSFGELLRPLSNSHGYSIVTRLENLPQEVDRFRRKSIVNEDSF